MVRRAFGLDLAVSFRFPGLPGPSAVPASPPRPATLDLTTRRALLADFDGADLVWEGRRADGRRAATIRGADDGGYLLVAEGFGAFAVRDRGAAITCAPVRTAAWRWQRYVIGQVLPLAAVAHGLEVFHASVVRVGAAAVAVTGPSGAGKSSVAAALLARGAELVADDVMAVDPAVGVPADRLLVEPGWGLMSIRHDAAARLDPMPPLGPVIGRDDEATRYEATVVDRPVPLAAVYVLQRQDGPGALVETMTPIEPRLLLASSYNFFIRSPARLVRHLDACTRMAATAVVAHATVRPGSGPSALAAAIEQHVATAVA